MRRKRRKVVEERRKVVEERRKVVEEVFRRSTLIPNQVHLKG